MIRTKTYHSPRGEEVTRTDYTEEGRLHREDGPAICCEGYQGWFLNGICQRAEFASGTVFAIQKD